MSLPLGERPIETRTLSKISNSGAFLPLKPTLMPSPFDDPRVMDSTDALDLDNIPKRLLIVGGGIIGLEMATVYAALGSEITVVERLDQLRL
jgi:pyruvate/2-oxoglutarate dehydrogenase complex dihydrolipoamide dehydrogenase (E3) component